MFFFFLCLLFLHKFVKIRCVSGKNENPKMSIFCFKKWKIETVINWLIGLNLLKS